MVLRFIYTLLIGIFLAVFVGVGISAFYKGPAYPEMPAELKFCSPEFNKVEQSDELKSKAEAFDKEEKLYREQSQLYNRNVSIVAVIAAVFLVISSLTLFRKILLIADGILLGGVLTLLYSTIRGFGTEDTRFLFIVVSVGLIISLLLGYVKFIQPTTVSHGK
jgi:hypothetical protein